MPDRINVLVLGVGGNVSQGILKALAVSKLECRVVGACVDSRSFGLFTVDKAYVSPFASAPDFIDWVIRVCRKEEIHAVLSGVEPVLWALSLNEALIRSETGAICIVSSPDCLRVGDDKLYTCWWLEERRFAFPRYAGAADAAAVERLVAECGYALIAKPREGKSARGVMRIHNHAELQFVLGKKDYVVEQYLGTEQDEYTIGCFSDRDGEVRGTMAMRRELLEGTTYRAEAVDRPDVRAEAIRITRALKPMGPCNLQMRVHEGRPVCFEINVRFSGTTPIRARLGFNDVEASLRHYVLQEPAVDLPSVTRGTALRYWNEFYPDAASLEKLDGGGGVERPGGFLEDYGFER